MPYRSAQHDMVCLMQTGGHFIESGLQSCHCQHELYVHFQNTYKVFCLANYCVVRPPQKEGM